MVGRVVSRAQERLFAGLALGGVLALGASAMGLVERESRARVDELRTHEVRAEKAEQVALGRELRFTRDEGVFATELEGDERAFGLVPRGLEPLKAPQRAFVEVTDSVTLSPGRSFLAKRGHLRVTASVERVTFAQHGASVAALHAVATVTNVSDVPVGYFVRLRSESRGRCDVRGGRMHNAMALLPGESAEIVVCAGGGSIVIDELRGLEVTPIGHVYLSKVPPQAVGYDPVTARSHRPLARAEVCTKVPAAAIANGLRAGDVTWEDIADFYSRHNCERVQYVPGYKLAVSRIESLPVLRPLPVEAPAPAPADPVVGGPSGAASAGPETAPSHGG